MVLLDFEVIGLIEEDDDAPQEIIFTHLEVEIFFSSRIKSLVTFGSMY